MHADDRGLLTYLEAIVADLDKIFFFKVILDDHAQHPAEAANHEQFNDVFVMLYDY